MVKERNLWKEAFENKLHADRSWERALESNCVEKIKIAIDQCNRSEWKLILEERKLREKKIYGNQRY